MALCAAFLFLFITNYVQVQSPKPTGGNVESKAEFIITMSWPDKNFDDLDLWLKLPDKRLVGYLSKDRDYAHLDRDDLGIYGDYHVGPNGPVTVFSNKEVISIRAIVPGKYVVNAHVFNVHDSMGNLKSEVMLPYNVTVTLTKLNPTVQEIKTIAVPFDANKQQKTAFIFEITPDGKVINIDTKTEISFFDDMGASASGMEEAMPVPAPIQKKHGPIL